MAKEPDADDKKMGKNCAKSGYGKKAQVKKQAKAMPKMAKKASKKK